MKLFFASALLVAASSAVAAPQTKIVTVGTEGIFGPWSSVCVDNTELTADVQAQYRYGTDGDWTDITIEQNTLVMFAQKFASDSQPMPFAIQFVNGLNGVGGATLSYTLDETVTRFRAHNCDAVTNYGFQMTATDGNTFDLGKIQ